MMDELDGGNHVDQAMMEQFFQGEMDGDDDMVGQPMDEFLANAFGGDDEGSAEKLMGKMQKQGLMMNSLQLADDGQNDFELENAAFNFNALTMLPKEDKNNNNIDKTSSNKPNFESIGTFKGIRGLSNNFNGLSELQDLHDESEKVEQKGGVLQQSLNKVGSF